MTPAPSAIPADQLDEAIEATIRAVVISPHSTVADIVRLCNWFSTREREVYARIECADGKPVAYLVRGYQQDFLPAFLRRQAE
jgi:hypothetical protein